jgi:hypothetical protein
MTVVLMELILDAQAPVPLLPLSAPNPIVTEALESGNAVVRFIK